MRRTAGSGLLTLAICATVSIGCSGQQVYDVSDGSVSLPNSNIQTDNSFNGISETDGCEHYSGNNPSWEKLINDYAASVREVRESSPQSAPEDWQKEIQFLIDSRNPETNVSKKDVYSAFPSGAAAAVGKLICENTVSEMQSNPENFANENSSFYLRNSPGSIMSALMICQEKSSRPQEKFPELHQGMNLKIYQAACPQYL